VAFFVYLRITQVDKTAEAETQIDAPSDTKQLEALAPTRKSSRKSILALSVFALGLNATAAVYTMSPSDFTLPDVSRLAELLPRQKAFDSTPDPVVAALKDIQSAQQQHVASLQENSSSLQQNTALLVQDSTTLASLRESITDERVDVKKISAQITDEHVDVKKMSAQISTLIAKVDSLQNAVAPEVTSSIPTGHARNRLSGVLRKRMARQPKALGPVSIGGAPLSFPVITPAPEAKS
jgi:uncharacterized coiled-coil protein SlyX